MPMDHSSATFRPEVLLAHREWVERTARALVHGDAEAEDVAQQAWLEVLQHPPTAEPERPQGWLRSVLRFTALDRMRSERRRRRHEAAAARPDHTEASPPDIVARAELLDRVVHLVLELEEPFRTTVLLRYFEDLMPAAIAARQGIPVETVRSRLKRAVAQLRGRLDAENEGDRRHWCLALLPLLRRPSPGTAATVASTGAAAGGVLAMGVFAKAAIVTGALLLIAGVGLLLHEGGPPVPAARLTGNDTRVAPSVAPAPLGQPSTRSTTGLPEPALDGPGPKGPPVPPPEAPPPGRTISGRVTDSTTGDPLPGIRVCLHYWPAGASRETNLDGTATEDDGRYSFSGLPDAERTYFVTFAEPTVTMPTDYLAVQVEGVKAGRTDVDAALRRGLAIAGTVVDDKGEPVRGEIRLSAFPTRGGSTPPRDARTGKGGTFRIGALLPETYSILATPWPMQDSELLQTMVEEVAAGDEGYVLRLRKGARFHGLVVDAEGRPQGGGTLRAVSGNQAWESPVAPDGTLQSQALDPDKDWTLIVWGYPDGRGAVLEHVRPGGSEVRLNLVSGDRELCGILVDESGVPLGAGIAVEVAARGEDLDRFGPGGRGTATTRPGGTFSFHGLRDLSFSFKVTADGQDLAVDQPKEVHPGSDAVTVRVRRGLLLSGTLVDDMGHPFRAEKIVVTWANHARSIHQDEKGQFRLGGLPPGSVTLQVHLGLRTVDLGPYTLPAEGLTLTVPKE